VEKIVQGGEEEERAPPPPPPYDLQALRVAVIGGRYFYFDPY
jgi:hypothetical protein